MSKAEQIDGADSDAVESKIYKGTEFDYCAKCKRLLKNKTCCMLNNGDLICFDNDNDPRALSAASCSFIEYVEQFFKTRNLELSQKNRKVLAKIIEDLI